MSSFSFTRLIQRSSLAISPTSTSSDFDFTFRCSAFALFLKSQRKWASPPLSPRSIALFKHRMKVCGFLALHRPFRSSQPSLDINILSVSFSSLRQGLLNATHPYAAQQQLNFSPETDVLVHGNYLVNLGNPDATKRKVSYDCFLDEIRRCGELGIRLLNIQCAVHLTFQVPTYEELLTVSRVAQARRFR